MATGRKKTAKSRALEVEPTPKYAVTAELVKAGVAAFIPKDATLDNLLSTIRSVAKGTTRPPPAQAKSSPPTGITPATEIVNAGQISTSVRMTRCEQNVIELIAQGRSNKQIAELLGIAITTVRTHVHNILVKLSLLTRIELVAYARKGSGSE